jgi:hypothetical protein
MTTDETTKVDHHVELRATAERLVQLRELDASAVELPADYEPCAPRVLILDW